MASHGILGGLELCAGIDFGWAVVGCGRYRLQAGLELLSFRLDEFGGSLGFELRAVRELEAQPLLMSCLHGVFGFIMSIKFLYVKLLWIACGYAD